MLSKAGGAEKPAKGCPFFDQSCAQNIYIMEIQAMGGFTKIEKENYKHCGYHNYKEFIDDLDVILFRFYNKDHGITYTKKTEEYRQPKYGRKLENHKIIFDVSNACEEAEYLLAISGKTKKLICSGRDMFLSYMITRDIEESIEDSIINK